MAKLVGVLPLDREIGFNTSISTRRKKKLCDKEKKMTGEIGAEAREGLVGLVMMM